MNFSEMLKKVMQDLNINQKQLSGLTGIGKSSISQYLSGKNIPTEERQKDIAVSLGLPENYFIQEIPDIVSYIKSRKHRIPSILVEDAAWMLGMSSETVRKGLIQGEFGWGYAIKTSANRWTYFINAKRFAEIEGIET